MHRVAAMQPLRLPSLHSMKGKRAGRLPFMLCRWRVPQPVDRLLRWQKPNPPSALRSNGSPAGNGTAAVNVMLS